ncbi:heavy metal-binding domain-containing protein [Zobellia laminariae]|uniref:heavy metal-binding domain-containing protein n=1 Tax=Zobellia laminariae TaxID=248906 RepID=UPI0026F46F11|nr:heavy metal-binding domain-containing protein [Zobellia laminariae]WKX76921.1 heavy metal-binding domain-containing protein [Zobellia laminariae]
MKNLRIILAAMVVIASMTITSCKDNKKEAGTETETSAENQGTEYTSAYVCPMHCEGSGSDTEGTCPKCGMTYVMNEDHKANGHTHN